MKQSVLAFLILASVCLFAQSGQKNELGLLLGGEFVPQHTTTAGEKNFGNSVVFSAN